MSVSTIVAVRTVLPEHCYPQSQITEAFVDMCVGSAEREPLLRRLHSNSAVGTRHLALPIERYAGLGDFGASNDAYIDAAVALGARAVLEALEEAGLEPWDVDTVVSTTVTGFAVPSLEARIASVIGLRPDVRRVPLMGLGCLGGAAGISRTADLLLGRPRDVAVLLAVELCSLTLQRRDTSTAAFVASGLFGDGAAAVVMVGDEHRLSTGASPAGPAVVAARGHLYPDSERVMGWDIGADGLKIVLDARVPDVVEQYLGEDVRAFLADSDLKQEDVSGWVCHPGGPRVIEAIQRVLALPYEAVAHTWRSLAEVGNLSSASVLDVLGRTVREGSLPAGSPVVLMAMGPGFCSELVLLRW
ncbi:MAG: type polyketide synthase [Nocardioidaceae bacterium]|nr:type polyketide synthase [Nocardioidaceae bacterium]